MLKGFDSDIIYIDWLLIISNNGGNYNLASLFIGKWTKAVTGLEIGIVKKIQVIVTFSIVRICHSMVESKTELWDVNWVQRGKKVRIAILSTWQIEFTSRNFVFWLHHRMKNKGNFYFLYFAIQTSSQKHRIVGFNLRIARLSLNCEIKVLLYFFIPWDTCFPPPEASSLFHSIW